MLAAMNPTGSAQVAAQTTFEQALADNARAIEEAEQGAVKAEAAFTAAKAQLVALQEERRGLTLWLRRHGASEDQLVLGAAANGAVTARPSLRQGVLTALASSHRAMSPADLARSLAAQGWESDHRKLSRLVSATLTNLKSKKRVRRIGEGKWKIATEGENL